MLTVALIGAFVGFGAMIVFETLRTLQTENRLARHHARIDREI